MHPTRRRLTGLLAALVAIAGTTTVAATAKLDTSASPVDASAKGGDPYFPWDGNGGYQVRHYAITATYVPADGRLRGRTQLLGTADDRALRSLSVDLALTPDWVRVDGVRAGFSKPTGHELRVRPATPIGAGADFTVAVGYRGKPHRVRANGVRPFLWSRGEAMAIGEPQIGPWWFAANETPTDKASYDVTIRVPRGQQAISNGRLLGRSTSGKWTTWRWQQAEPILTYLAFFGAGRFELRRSQIDGRENVYAVSRQLSASAREQSFRLLERTPGATRWLEEWLGDYPYSTSGGVVSALWAGFALENAGRPTYPYLGGPDRPNVSLVVHELAHQWFGDDVSLRRWRDIWLNEGLASYAEWKYAEDTWGDQVQERLVDEHANPYRGSGFWGLVISDPGPDDVFAQPVYDRGAMTVAALRCRIGEATLDLVLRRWLAERSGGHGTDPQFRALAEEVSGQELDDFFSAWLDTGARPAKTADNGLSDCV